jgi:3-hydroxyacyl-CoA dehydrogenase
MAQKKVNVGIIGGGLMGKELSQHVVAGMPLSIILFDLK